MQTRSQRLDAVAHTISQVEVDCAVALVAFGNGYLSPAERTLRLARERLSRAIAVVKRRGGEGVR